MSKRKQKEKGIIDVKTRKKNWSGTEVEVVLQEVEKNKNVLFSSVQKGIKGPQKTKIWAEITAAVNIISGEFRAVADVKKKMVRH